MANYVKLCVREKIIGVRLQCFTKRERERERKRERERERERERKREREERREKECSAFKVTQASEKL